MANKNIPAKTKTAHLQMGDVVQHIHQHTPDPRDLDYRAQAFSFALQAHRDMAPGVAELIGTASEIEAYLRDGTTQPHHPTVGEEYIRDGQA